MILRIVALPFLVVLSFLYRGGLFFDRIMKSRRRKWLSRPVVSIGNLTVGGTGKTPLLMRLCEDLLSRGVRPAILSRGYRGWGKASLPSVVQGDDKSLLMNDEVRLMAKKFPSIPIGVGPDRFASAQKILSTQPVDVFLLDDGFQHWKLARDTDLVTVDATNPFGGGHLLPWGRLREPLRSLERATAVILTRTELLPPKRKTEILTHLSSLVSPQKIMFSNFEFHLRRISGEPVDLLALKNRSVIACSGIGNPAAFEKNLSEFGAIVTSRRFTDHHPFTNLEVETILKEAKDKGALVVITEKDAVKIDLQDDSLYVLEASLTFMESARDGWGHLLHDISKLSLRA